MDDVLQSQTALESARKDFSQVVNQAQKELGKLTTTEATRELSEESSDSRTDHATDSEAVPSAEGDTVTPTPAVQDAPAPSASTSATASSLFSRLQSSLPPSIVSTVQHTIPATLKSASTSLDLAQLRATTEEYVHRSEDLLRGAMKEAGEVLRDAVKVVPPSEADGGAAAGMVWDGSDMWMLPDAAGASADAPARGKGKGKATAEDAEAQRAVVTRAESLLKQVRQNPDILKHDPAAEGPARELYLRWVEAEVTGKDDGIDGDEWRGRIAGALHEAGSGETLQTTHDALGRPLVFGRCQVSDAKSAVPSVLTEGEFWTRYFFRVHQIQLEEAKRKALLQGNSHYFGPQLLLSWFI